MSYIILHVFFKGVPGSDGHPAKMEEWTSVPSMTSMSSRSFPSGINGVEKPNNELDIKYPQQVSNLNISCKQSGFFCTRNTFNCRKVQIKYDFYVYFGSKTGINSGYEIKLVNMSQALHELENKSVIYSTRMNLSKAESFCVWILLYLLLFCHLLVLLWW